MKKNSQIVEMFCIINNENVTQLRSFVELIPVSRITKYQQKLMKFHCLAKYIAMDIFSWDTLYSVYIYVYIIYTQ